MNLIDPRFIDPYDIILTAIADAADFIAHYRNLHFTDDDTDYLPAAIDLLRLLSDLLCDDFADDLFADFFTNLAHCRPLNPDFTPCLHIAALDFHHTLDLFAPSYDDCPNFR